jgi:hexosaminidase
VRRAPGASARVLAAPDAGAGDALTISDAAELGGEGYRLRVTADGARIDAATPEGLFRGAHTLLQLVPVDGPRILPSVEIEDRPRFPWRGAMLDVARHFLPPRDVMRFIDHMAQYKLDRLHLHLTDDQGWRIAIGAWPRLAEHGGQTAVGGGPGGFYTQEEYAAIVTYAAERFVTVVPEVDTPGHTHAALAAYPELTGSEEPLEPYTGTNVGFSSLRADLDITYRFFDDVVGELAALTPGPWLHLGGDEARSTSREDYVTFLERAQAIVTEHGKRVVGWEELGAVPLAEGAVVQYWNTRDAHGPELARSTVANGGRVLMSPAGRTYLDMKYDRSTRLGQDWAGHVEVRDAYDWDPATLVEGVDEADVIGVEAALWSETLTSLADVEYMAFPRLPAVAEVAWSPAARDWEDFRARLAGHAARWDAQRIGFHRSPQIQWP